MRIRAGILEVVSARGASLARTPFAVLAAYDKDWIDRAP
jgi:hypothetical protein